MNRNNRPYIICHMVQSIDGKVTGDFLYTETGIAASEVYYEINRSYQADAFACGRVTMEGSFTGGFYPDLSKYSGITIPHKDHIADRSAEYFAVSFDRSGRLGWTQSRIHDEDLGYDNAHIIEVLTDSVNDAYLAYLRDIGVSYIFAEDLRTALGKLKKLFGIQKLMLEGGSIINGAFARENCIDELSLVAAPIIGKTVDKPLFMESIQSDFTLQKTKTYDSGIIWLNYVKNDNLHD